MSGSGSPTIRGILHYVNRWGEKPLDQFFEDEAVTLVLRLLTSAAEFDSATGGIDREANLYPVVKRITKEGVCTISDAALKATFESQVLQYV